MVSLSHAADHPHGASSAGKTSLVKAFCATHPFNYKPVYIDEFIKTLTPAQWKKWSGSDEDWAKIGMVFNDHLKTIFDKHPNLIADAFYKSPTAREHLFKTLGRENIFYVQLYCKLTVLERREKERGNRKIGLARSQHAALYAFDAYDLKIDSTELSREETANKLINAINALDFST